MAQCKEMDVANPGSSKNISSEAEVCLFCAKRLEKSSKTSPPAVIENESSQNDRELDLDQNKGPNSNVDSQRKVFQIIFKYLNVQRASVEQNEADEALLVGIGEDKFTGLFSLPFCSDCRSASDKVVSLQKQLDEVVCSIKSAVQAIQNTIVDSSPEKDKAMKAYFHRLQEFKNSLMNRGSKDADEILCESEVKDSNTNLEEDDNNIAVVDDVRLIQNVMIPSSSTDKGSDIEATEDDDVIYVDDDDDNEDSVSSTSSEEDNLSEVDKSETEENSAGQLDPKPSEMLKDSTSSTVETEAPPPVQVIIIHEKSVPVKCKYCKITVKNRLYLPNHIRKFHPNAHWDADGSLKLNPPVNNTKRKELGEAGSEKVAYATVVGNPFKCSDCGREFIQPSALTRHKRVHNGLPLYTCHICKKVLNFENTFHAHLKLHETKKSLFCDQCPAVMSSLGQFNLHMKRHAGEFAVFCPLDWCQKGFVNKNSLEPHMKYHERNPFQTMPYHCHICGSTKRFAKTTGLRTHLRNFHYRRGTFIPPPGQISTFIPFFRNKKKDPNAPIKSRKKNNASKRSKSAEKTQFTKKIPVLQESGNP